MSIFYKSNGDEVLSLPGSDEGHMLFGLDGVEFELSCGSPNRCIKELDQSQSGTARPFVSCPVRLGLSLTIATLSVY